MTVSTWSERGSAPLDAVVAIVLLMILTLGTIQVALTLYGRNVVDASAHEGLRALVERNAAASDAAQVATASVRDSVGSLVGALEVDVASSAAGGGRVVRVMVRARLKPLGPVPVTIPVVAGAEGFVEAAPR